MYICYNQEKVNRDIGAAVNWSQFMAVKRETGEIPVRSRRCERRIPLVHHWRLLLGRAKE